MIKADFPGLKTPKNCFRCFMENQGTQKRIFVFNGTMTKYSGSVTLETNRRTGGIYRRREIT